MFSRTSRGAYGGASGGRGVGRGSSIVTVSNTAEWAGLLPLVDWNMSNAVLSGSNITSVPNATGLVANVLTGVASNNPTIVTSSSNFNSNPAAAFSGTLRFSHGALGPSGNVATVVMVSKSNIDGNDHTMWEMSSIGGLLYSAAGTGFVKGWLNDGFSGINSNNAISTSSISMLTLSGGTQRLYVNSTTEDGNTASAGVNFTGGGIIGNYPPLPLSVFSLNGEMARFMVFATLLTSGERASVMTALASKYGITLT